MVKANARHEIGLSVQGELQKAREVARQKRDTAIEAGRLSTEATNKARALTYSATGELSRSLAEGFVIKGLDYKSSDLKLIGDLVAYGRRTELHLTEVSETNARKLVGKTAMDAWVELMVAEYDEERFILSDEELPHRISFTVGDERYRCDLSSLDFVPVQQAPELG